MANTIIQIKSSGVTGNVPQTLQPGELAINYVDGKLFYGNTTSQPVELDTITEPAGLDGEIQFNDSGVLGSSSGLTYDGVSLKVNGNLESVYHNGDEGGEIFLHKADTNTTLNNGVTLDVFQNKLRIFENGGSNRGVYIDIANGAATGVGTDLLASGAAGSYANSAYLHANAAFTYANALSGGTATDGWARSIANSAYTQANSSFNNSNTAILNATSASSYANSAYTQANTGTILAQAAFDYANTIVSDTQIDPYAREKANAAFDKANTTSGAVLVTSNVTSVTTGATIAVAIDMANVAYPGGIFTIYQQDAYVLTVTNIWQSGSANKNAYSNLAANIVNTQNVTLNVALTNATFNVQTGDTITIGSSTITGANLISLGITGTGGSYLIPSSYLLSNVQTNSSSAVSASLTTSRGVATDTATTLTNTQATPFSINQINASFPSTTVPYFNKTQSINWSISVVGTVSSGNLTYSGGSSGSLTSTGQTSGTSTLLDSTLSYTITTSDYRGTGYNGSGTRTIPSPSSKVVTPATTYTPLFYKITGSNSNPNFNTSDFYITSNYSVGDGANTSDTTTQYLWMAIPGTDEHTFAFDFLNTQVTVNPDVRYNAQSIGTETYNVYGFTNFSAITEIYTTS